MELHANEFMRSLALHLLTIHRVFHYGCAEESANGRKQTQLLAGLQWLGEHQVIACVPLNDSVPFKDVADICGVPEDLLCRITRLMATAGFFQEPVPGKVAHSPLSAQFVTEPALLDAVRFLAGTAALAALKMPLATQQLAASERPDRTAYAAAFETATPFAGLVESQPRLRRQFARYVSSLTGDDHAAIQDVLLQMDWASIGDATAVEIGAPSPSSAISLATLFPSLQIILQTHEPSPTGPSFLVPGGGCLTTPPCPEPTGSRAAPPLHVGGGPANDALQEEIPAHLSSQITLQRRTPGTTQFVRAAAVYILHLPAPSPSLPWAAVSAHAVSELAAHLDVLRANPGARIVLTALVLPPPHHDGIPRAEDAETEAAARVRDLSLLQLANGRLPDQAEVLALLGGIRDGAGGLVVTDEIRAAGSAFVAWEVRYQEGRGEVRR